MDLGVSVLQESDAAASASSELLPAATALLKCQSKRAGRGCAFTEGAHQAAISTWIVAILYKPHKRNRPPPPPLPELPWLSEALGVICSLIGLIKALLIIYSAPGGKSILGLQFDQWVTC